jgi:hypothetical protein
MTECVWSTGVKIATGNYEVTGKNLSQCHLLQDECNMECPGNEPGPPGTVPPLNTSAVGRPLSECVLFLDSAIKICKYGDEVTGHNKIAKLIIHNSYYL